MELSKKIIYFVLTLCLGLSLLKSGAFFTPDLEVFGKNPVIEKIDPKYLIPGRKVKIIGKNFFEVPKSANKLWINDYPVTIHSATSEMIEIVVPRIPLGKASIRFFTYYLGYKSSEVFYPHNREDFIYITFAGPEIKSTNTSSVKPNDYLTIMGNFQSKNPLFFKIGNEEIQAEVLSNNTSQIKLPSKLQKGLFKIKAFYKRINLKTNSYIISSESNELTLYNNELGSPVILKLNISEKFFEDPNIGALYNVSLFFKGGEATDVTNYSYINLSQDGIFEIDKNNNVLRPLTNGHVKIKAEFFWQPTNLKLTDSLDLIVQIPQKPHFEEVIINEIFPFASPFFPLTDANMDGFAKSNDEFIEIKNLTNKKIDLSKCQIFLDDEKESSYEFPLGSIIAPDSYLEIFNKDGNLNLPNNGSTIELLCEGNTIDYIAYQGGKNGDPSWQRNGDLNGFQKHPIELFSPGKSPPEFTILDEPIPLTTDNINNKPIIIKEISSFPNELLFNDQFPQNLSVIGNFSSGERKDITNEASYKSTNEDVVKVSTNGVVTPLTNGTSTIEISYEDKIIEVIANVNFISNVQPKQLIINEILVAPNADVNKDGIFKSDQDEFIEIVNILNTPLDISNLLISDNTKVRHIFPQGTILQSFEPIIIFGGGIIGNFSTSKVQTATTGSLGLNNTGQEQVTISTSDNRIIDQVSFDNSNLQGTSLNRTGDLSFNNLSPHEKFLKSISKYSPGTRIDGSPFTLLPQEGAELLKGSSSSGNSLFSPSNSSNPTNTSVSSSGYT